MESTYKMIRYWIYLICTVYNLSPHTMHVTHTRIHTPVPPFRVEIYEIHA